MPRNHSVNAASRLSLSLLEVMIDDLRNALKHLQNYAKVTYLGNPATILFWKSLIIAGATLAVSNAYAAEPDSCYVPFDRIPLDRPLAEGEPADPNTIVLETGELEARLSEPASASMTGGVLLQQGDRLAGAESARFDAARKALLFEGNVRYEDSGSQVMSDSAEFAYDLGRIRFEGADFMLDDSRGRGAAAALEINQRGTLELDDVSYTTCAPDSNDWLLQASSIDLDTRDGVGTAKGVKLKFQGVPILYAPYISFPIGDARKSGVLTPQFGSTNRSGNEFVVPFYWNIAPNYDATITPRLLTNRGLQLGTEFRYLTTESSGRAYVEYLDNDDILEDSRSLLQLEHRTLFANGWRNRIDYREVSDSQYFEDLGGSLSSASTTHLNRSLSVDFHTDTLSIFGQVQDLQTIDDAILPSEEPYRRMPQLLLRGSWPDQWLGMRFAIDSEVTNFDRDVGVTGWRLNVAPTVELPISRPGWFITPGVTLDYTRYELSDTEADQATDPSRTVPIGSLDVGMLLERSMRGSSGDRVQTLEPRLLYVHVPHRDQDDLPVFDTITPDLNLVSLYRKNRFLGVDRIADADQLSIGLTSRILEASTGRELVSATVGQTRYLSSSGVTLPGEPLITEEESDYIAEARFLLYENLNFDVGHQWGGADSGTTRSEARLQYRPADNKILNLAYRYRRDTLEQGDISWSWPIGSQWNFVGRYKFSFRDDEAVEQFYGLEYESCCWGVRVVSRRYISRRDGTRDSSIGLQLVLKGFSSVGTAADKMLERGILGYSASLR